MTVLVIEDEEEICDSILKALSKNGYNAFSFSSVHETEDFLKGDKGSFDIVILDINLSDNEGFYLLEKGIIDKDIPVLFLTVRDDEEDILKGFSLGAEDYIRKPFLMKELLARIRRIEKLIINKEKENKIIAGDIIIDLINNTVIRREDGSELNLSPIERRLLFVLAKNKNMIISREILLDYIYEWTGNEVFDHTLTVYMNRLRKKTGEEAFEIIRGMGYRIREDRDAL